MPPLVNEFLARSLPKSDWTHEAHLSVGLWHLRQYGFDEALTRMREGICAYNEAIGTANTTNSGYHETLTQFWLRVLDAQQREADAETAFADGLSRILDSSWVDRTLALRYYRRETLFSPLARATWVGPDLQPFDF
ncbi:MAG: hypothetical protein H7Y12_06975 [Sphingobacteriaceae bacterium]|nr:hypothetical protein [Cytophagaceae bacterium]